MIITYPHRFERKRIKNKVKIRYDLIGALISVPLLHPQEDILCMGAKIDHYEGVPIGDCIIMEVTNLPLHHPSYITML